MPKEGTTRKPTRGPRRAYSTGDAELDRRLNALVDLDLPGYAVGGVSVGEPKEEMQRIVARLYLVEEFDHSEIARMTGLTEGTVRSHLSLARGKLKLQLSDLYEGTHE